MATRQPAGSTLSSGTGVDGGRRGYGRQGSGRGVVDLDGGGHDVAPGAAGEGAGGDRGLHRGVADLVHHDVEGAGAECGRQGRLVVAVGDEAGDAGGWRGGAAVDDRDLMARHEQAFHQELSEVPASADDADL
ncbi:hypothetical protein C0Q64_10260 [Streptomyces albidoflavus]|nr:hypothetical protein C0Q64_10260 [Streptomyces albidoflavus]RZE04007.1 hypothetical protein C0Q65_10590 [Streptomyces albidoflavus]